jgi:hypothetical protein
MKKLLSLTAAAALLFAIFAVRPGYSDDADTKAKAKKPAAAKSTAAKQKAQAAKQKKPRGRLPNYFGKIGVSGEQRTKIYAIQKGYQPQLVELRKQIADLIAKRDAEMASVLTDSQKEQLSKLREEAKKRAADRRKKAATDRFNATKKKLTTEAEK